MSLDDRSNVEDSESVKDLGETTDLLNLVGEAYYYLLKKHACLCNIYRQISRIRPLLIWFIVIFNEKLLPVLNIR